ncbi:9756_t:CDS:2 [Gigaspora margarita]|uniref:9756_t:CDS:1 n=1 Tax=Gigaspora margarita TaxID=4874 RepID=A0ABN7ULA0_GIGMA|nr:9756_t:CDS:2 [Gigaspora margarita]
MAEIDQFVLAKIYHIISIHNGISTQLKNKNSFILEHCCISHKLTLAAKDATNQHIIHLKIIEKNTGNPQFTVLNIIETCWLLLSNVIQNLHPILNSVIDALLEDSEENIVAKALYDIPAIITKFANATIESLEKRFPNRIQINAFYIFDPIALPINNSDFQNYGEDEIEILGNFYGQDKYVSGNLFSARLDSKNLKY